MRYKIEKFKNCFSIFSEIVKDRVMTFSDMIDLSIGVAVFIGLKISDITSGRHRKWKRNGNFSNVIFQIKTYNTFLGLFSSVQNKKPDQKLSINFRLFLKQVSNSQFSMPISSLITEVFHLKLIYVVDTLNFYSNGKWFL
jgi:hypothetical protein